MTSLAQKYWQDSGDSLTGKTVCVRHSDAGSTPSSPLHFSKAKLLDVKEFIQNVHYSHTIPAGITHIYNLFFNNTLSGACAFGYGAGNPRSYWCYPPCLFRELVRFVLLDTVPKNAESMFLGWALRTLAKDAPELIAVTTFADPVHNHRGIIYRATNWHYLGQFKAHRGSGRGPYSSIAKHKFIYVFPGTRGQP